VPYRIERMRALAPEVRFFVLPRAVLAKSRALTESFSAACF
jgi:hypothetical protein